MRSSVFAAALVVLCASQALAQLPPEPAPILKGVVGVFASGKSTTQAPDLTFEVTVATTVNEVWTPVAACQLAPSTATASSNPKNVTFTSPYDASKMCSFPISVTIPKGNGWRVAVKSVAAACGDGSGGTLSPCEGDWSEFSNPFDVRPQVGKPAKLTGVAVRP